MKSTAFCLGVLLSATIGCAQTAPSTQLVVAPEPAAEKPASPAAQGNVDEVLDMLHDRGEGLKGIRSGLTLTETDTGTGGKTARVGSFVLQIKPDGDSRIHVTYTQKIQDDKPRNEKLEYKLENGWLTERDYRTTTESRYQVSRPGEKIDLFKLGKGPFPLPIGQDKAEVRKHFDPSIVAPTADDPKGTIHLRLLPVAGTTFARDYSSVDVYVDPTNKMPARIETMDINMSKLRTTEFSDTKVNPENAVGDSDFALDPVSGWTRHEEELQK